jgi:hypothetical protein
VIYKRTLSPEYVADLKCGVLSPILDRIRLDDTLMLAIRNDYVNIYYRGGNLFEITRSGPVYHVKFDTKYSVGFPPLSMTFPRTIRDSASASVLAAAVPEVKFVMDRYFSGKHKAEREFQQLVVRENNRSPISNETEYFIVDVEVAIGNARFDMLAVRWLRSERKKQGVLVPALIEMKYGINALNGKAGLRKHLDDACHLRSDSATWHSLVEGIEKQLDQLDCLGLLKYNRSPRIKRLQVNADATPEVILLLANCNPAGTQLERILGLVSEQDLLRDGLNLRFFASCFAGYGMHHASMLNLTDFKAAVSKLLDLSGRRGQGR